MFVRYRAEAACQGCRCTQPGVYSIHHNASGPRKGCYCYPLCLAPFCVVHKASCEKQDQGQQGGAQGGASGQQGGGGVVAWIREAARRAKLAVREDLDSVVAALADSAKEGSHPARPAKQVLAAASRLLALALLAGRGAVDPRCSETGPRTAARSRIAGLLDRAAVGSCSPSRRWPVSLARGHGFFSRSS